MVTWKQRATRLANISEKVLAVFGFVSLIYAGYTSIDKVTDAIPKPEVVVTPFCVPLLDGDYKYEDGTKAPMELRGFTIQTAVDISDIMFRIDGQSYVTHWSVSSSGTPPNDIAQLISQQLPKGPINAEPIFGKLSRLMAGKDIIIQFGSVATNKFKCSSEWFHISVPGQKVFHSVWPESFHIRELTFTSIPFDPYKYAFFALLAGGVVFAIAKSTKPVRRRNAPPPGS